MYDNGHNCQLSDDSGVSFSIETSVIDTILRNISSRGFDAQKDIEPELFNHTLEALNNAVSSVFIDVSYEDDDFDFVNTLKHNNAVFAAFKTHRQQSDIHKQMFNEDGKVRSFAQFRKATESIIRNYNTNWLQTEYNTAIIRAQFAQKWQAMERDRDIYPNVQWLPSTSVNPREAHLALYYKVFAFDDPFLRSNYPGSMWNCKCGAKSTNLPLTEGAEVKSLTKSTPKAQAGLDVNPGTSGKLFSDSHPYIANYKKSQVKDILLACDKLMSDSSRKSVRSHFKEDLKMPQIMAVKNGPVEKVTMSYQNIKTITGKPHKFNYAKNMACHNLPEILQTAKYVGSSPDIKPGQNGHDDILHWHYYTFNIKGESSYLTIKENQEGICSLHSIEDDNHFKQNKIKEKP